MNEFVIHEVVDSTSAEAQRMCTAQQTAPFAVMAKMQTAGRGRRGRGWSSMPGNLMMTVVLPAQVWTAGQGLETAPLKAAILVARFIRDRFGIRVTLKWPNDVLFAGRKLAGILCESSSTGASFGDLLVGIGLNMSAAPHLSGADGVGTICLEEILGRQQSSLPDCATVGRELATWMIANWNVLDPNSLSGDFEEFGIESGQIFLSETEAAIANGIDSGGAFLLKPVKGEKSFRLTSADQTWRWLYQVCSRELGVGATGNRPPIMVADVGNSRIKIAVWKSAADAVPVVQCSVVAGNLGSVDWAAMVLGASIHKLDVPLICHAVSVNASNLQMFSDAALVSGIRVQTFSKRTVMLRSNYSWTEIGVDRVAAMEGFLAGLDPSVRGDDDAIGVVVCAGTATTIDLVTFAGRHFGGVIMPGITTSLHALHVAAPALPDLSREAAKVGSVNVIGLSTHDAILGGELAMVAGAIQVLLEQARCHLGSKIRVVFTGGHAKTVMLGFKKLTNWECDLLVKDYLILEGVRSMILGGFDAS